MRSRRSLFGPASLSLASLLALSALPGCKQIEELTEGKKEEETKTEEAKAETKTEEAAPADAADEDVPEVGEKVAVAGTNEEVEVLPPEPIPVEELHTGLDLMLKLVPDDSEFMIARDASVVADYVEEGTRFLDGPLAKLKTGPFAGERELQDIEKTFDEVKAKTDVIKTALDASGIQLAEGAAMYKDAKGESFIIFNAPDPNALVAVGKATGESDMGDLKCKAVGEVAPGFNICADDQAAIDAYQPAEDPTPARTMLGEKLPGVNLDEANLLAHLNKGDEDELFMAVTTIPGQLHMAITMPGDEEMVEIEKGMQPGPAATLAQVQPGSGFVWARLSDELMKKSMSEMKELEGTPAAALTTSLTGEFMIAGSVSPGGLILQLGTKDTAALEGMLTAGFEAGKGQVPPGIPEVPGSKLAFEQVALEGGGKTAQALHLGVTGVPEGDVLAAYTGLHLDGWAFAANDVFTLAIGPNKDHVGKLLDVTPGGPSADTLASLPPQLAEGLNKNEVGMIVHMPMDFMHGAQMHSLLRAALKEVPEAEADQVLALTGLLAPFSSATMWIAQPSGNPVIHVSVQSIGNRATEEGRKALDAAHTVADGGDPVTAFATMAAAYGASPMAWAYKTRAGVEGPGYMVGSGVGAVLATAAVAVPLVMGKSNKALADDLGVKPDDPEPELKVTKPKQPVTKKKPKSDEPKKDQPKKDPKKDEPKSDDPKKDEPKKDDPIVEPKKPLPPKPTPDPGSGRRKGKFGRGQRGK